MEYQKEIFVQYFFSDRLRLHCLVAVLRFAYKYANQVPTGEDVTQKNLPGPKNRVELDGCGKKEVEKKVMVV